MKKIIIVSLTAGLLAIFPATLLADNSTNSVPNAEHSTAAAKKANNRREVLAILGLTKADLKGLSPEDRNSKIKDAADKKIAELQEKKTAGSLTEKEQANLDLLKKFEHHGHKAKTAS